MRFKELTRFNLLNTLALSLLCLESVFADCDQIVIATPIAHIAKPFSLSGALNDRNYLAILGLKRQLLRTQKFGQDHIEEIANKYISASRRIKRSPHIPPSYVSEIIGKQRLLRKNDYPYFETAFWFTQLTNLNWQPKSKTDFKTYTRILNAEFDNANLAAGSKNNVVFIPDVNLSASSYLFSHADMVRLMLLGVAPGEATLNGRRADNTDFDAPNFYDHDKSHFRQLIESVVKSTDDVIWRKINLDENFALSILDKLDRWPNEKWAQLAFTVLYEMFHEYTLGLNFFAKPITAKEVRAALAFNDLKCDAATCAQIVREINLVFR